MPDTRFHRRLGPFLVGDIVTLIGAKPVAPEEERIAIHDIAALRLAKPGEVSVFTDRRYLQALATTEASVIVTTEELARDAKHSERLLYVANPRLAFAQIGKLFYPAVAAQPGISEFARVQSPAKIGAGTQVDAGAVIGHDVEIGDDCHIAANVVLGDGVRIGDGSRIGAGSVVSHALIGNGVTIATCVTIGSEGFGFIPSANGLVKTSVPQCREDSASGVQNRLSQQERMVLRSPIDVERHRQTSTESPHLLPPKGESMQLIQQSHHSDAFKDRLMGICLGVTAEIVEENPTFVGVAELEDTVERAIFELAITGQSDPARLVRYASTCGKTLIREAELKLRTTLKPAQPFVRRPLGSYRYGAHKRNAQS